MGASRQEDEYFFKRMLGDVVEPTLPFGLRDVHQDGGLIAESRLMLEAGLNDRLRSLARRFGVSLASLCHLAWARVLACCSDQDDVVFGTVLFGREMSFRMEVGGPLGTRVATGSVAISGEAQSADQPYYCFEYGDEFFTQNVCTQYTFHLLRWSGQANGVADSP